MPPKNDRDGGSARIYIEFCIGAFEVGLNRVKVRTVPTAIPKSLAISDMLLSYSTIARTIANSLGDNRASLPKMAHVESSSACGARLVNQDVLFVGIHHLPCRLLALPPLGYRQ